MTFLEELAKRHEDIEKKALAYKETQEELMSAEAEFMKFIGASMPTLSGPQVLLSKILTEFVKKIDPTIPEDQK